MSEEMKRIEVQHEWLMAIQKHVDDLQTMLDGHTVTIGRLQKRQHEVNMALQGLSERVDILREEFDEIDPPVTYTRIDHKLKVCGEKSDTLDEHTCINPTLHEDPHQCECGYTWGGVARMEQRTACVILTEQEYRQTGNLGSAVEELRRKLERFGPREHIQIGAWEPTFTTVDNIMCPAWILKGMIGVNVT